MFIKKFESFINYNTKYEKEDLFRKIWIFKKEELEDILIDFNDLTSNTHIHIDYGIGQMPYKEEIYKFSSTYDFYNHLKNWDLKKILDSFESGKIYPFIRVSFLLNVDFNNSILGDDMRLIDNKLDQDYLEVFNSEFKKVKKWVAEVTKIQQKIEDEFNNLNFKFLKSKGINRVRKDMSSYYENSEVLIEGKLIGDQIYIIDLCRIKDN